MNNIIIKEKNIIKDLNYYTDIINIFQSKYNNIDVKNNSQYNNTKNTITKLNNDLRNIHIVFKNNNICSNCYLTNHTIDICPQILYKNRICNYCNKPFHIEDICPLKKQHIILSNDIDKFRHNGHTIPQYIWEKMDFLTKCKWVNYNNKYNTNNNLFNNIVPIHIDLWNVMNDSDKNNYLTAIGVIHNS